MQPNEAASSQGIPGFAQARELLLEHALTRGFPAGRLQIEGRTDDDFFRVLLQELEYAAWAASEWADPDGSHTGDERLLHSALAVLETACGQVQPDGRVTAPGDRNTGFFTLCPATRALRLLEPALSTAQRDRFLDVCLLIFRGAEANINRTHDYLNPRAMEAFACHNLFRLTGEGSFLDRCGECLDELCTRQYACGAQPYHTGGWVWGRRPAQVYQFLTATMMLGAALELERRDVIAYVHRLMEYELLANTRHAEPFVTPFEGLARGATPEAIAWQWPVAAACGQEFASLARGGYELWLKRALALLQHDGQWQAFRPIYPSVLNKALLMGVQNIPQAEPFLPKPGISILPDTSSFVVHTPQLDLWATLLAGHSALAQADCGSVRLYAVTVELTDTPTFRNAGLDSQRHDWRIPTELTSYHADKGSASMRGRVYTKWDDVENSRDERYLHARRLEVNLEYSNGELLLEYETVENRHLEPVSSRLLFLLAVRPDQASSYLTIGNSEYSPPAADSERAFFAQESVGTVRFGGPDGSFVEIVPESTTAECIVAERPEPRFVPYPGKEQNSFLSAHVKPAPEGTLRLAFEGVNVLDKGRFLIRFNAGSAS